MKERILRYLGFTLGAVLLLRRGEHKVPLDGQAEPPVHDTRNTEPTPIRTEPKHSRPAHGAHKTSAVQYAKRSYEGFSTDDCMTLGAALAYYTVFSLAPLLLTVISIAGLFFGREAVQN